MCAVLGLSAGCVPSEHSDPAFPCDQIVHILPCCQPPIPRFPKLAFSSLAMLLRLVLATVLFLFLLLDGVTLDVGWLPTLELSLAKLVCAFSVFVSVRLERQIDEELARFEARIEALPEVVDCWLMTGNHDYLLRAVTRDIEDFEKFLVGQLTKLGGVSSIESSIPLRCVKSGYVRYR